MQALSGGAVFSHSLLKQPEQTSKLQSTSVEQAFASSEANLNVETICSKVVGEITPLPFNLKKYKLLLWITMIISSALWDRNCLVFIAGTPSTVISL